MNTIHLNTTASYLSATVSKRRVNQTAICFGEVAFFGNNPKGVDEFNDLPGQGHYINPDFINPKRRYHYYWICYRYYYGT